MRIDKTQPTYLNTVKTGCNVTPLALYTKPAVQNTGMRRFIAIIFVLLRRLHVL